MIFLSFVLFTVNVDDCFLCFFFVFLFFMLNFLTGLEGTEILLILNGKVLYEITEREGKCKYRSRHNFSGTDSLPSFYS